MENSRILKRKGERSTRMRGSIRASSGIYYDYTCARDTSFSFLILRRHSVSFYRMRYTMLSSNSNKVFDADDWLHLDRSDARRFPLRCALFKMGRFQKRNVGISFRNNPVRLYTQDGRKEYRMLCRLACSALRF